MAAGSIEIVVLTDEPFHATYLRTVLQMELPGWFHVREAPAAEARAIGRADLVLMLGEATPSGDLPLPHLAHVSRSTPVIVVAQGRLQLDTLGQLIQEGADDVIDLSQLNTRGLAAAVLKAVRRRTRATLEVASWREATAVAIP